jgi:hypothetical protein
VFFGAQKAVLGVQSGVQAILRAVRRFPSDFWLGFPRFSPDIGRRCAVQGHWSGVTGGGSPPLNVGNMLDVVVDRYMYIDPKS